MELGKLNTIELKEILNYKGDNRKEVILGGKLGEDCSIIRLGGYDIALSTDPITSATKNIGTLAFNINSNDIASCGIKPLGILVTILAPEKTNIEDIEAIMRDLDIECKKKGVAIIGGHTEVTDGVNRIIVSVTAIGYGEAGSLVLSTNPQIGDDIVVTKELCIEGSSIIINDFLTKVEDILSKDEIEELRGNKDKLSVIREGEIGREVGVSSMHDITEGGILGAISEITANSKIGFKVYYEKMPISPSVIKICNKLGIDPLRLISSGSMLITTKNSSDLIGSLKKEGIKGTVIGKITSDRGILVKEGKEYNIYYNEKDEIYKLFGGKDES